MNENYQVNETGAAERVDLPLPAQQLTVSQINVSNQAGNKDVHENQKVTEPLTVNTNDSVLAKTKKTGIFGK